MDERPHRRVPTGLKHATVLCVLTCRRELLLLHRRKEPNFGLYVPVGGHLAPYEGPREAALREVREEAGLELQALSFCGVMIETAPVDYNWVSWIYAAEVPRVAPFRCAEGVLEWVAVDRLDELPAPETDRHIYRHVAEGRRFVFNAHYDAELRLLRLEDELSGRLLVERR